MSAMGGTTRGTRRPRRLLVTSALVAGLAVAAGGCGLVGGEKEATTSGPDDTLAPLAATEKVAVGLRHLAARCVGRAGDPSVLLVSGYDTDLSQSWDQAQPSIGTFARVCAYDRLGVGDSDEPPHRQSFADLADELDGVIDALELARPVVLVAHSLGGMVAATWAEGHRQDLAGLVFVDATPPSFMAIALETLPQDPAAKGGELRSGLASLLAPGANAEHLAGRASFDPPAVFGPVGSQPVVALTHSISEWGDLRRRDAAQLDSAWLGGQQAWADLSNQGRVQIVDQAGHFIQNDQPQAVVDAVGEVVGST
jgi:pimeloyl-ACP methyl ester carboxylesterase